MTNAPANLLFPQAGYKITLSGIKNLLILVLILMGGLMFPSCEKDPVVDPLPEMENLVPQPKLPPYEIPEIRTEADYARVIYIDPDVHTPGDGSLSSPLKVLPGTLQSNTAYLIKRGTTHPAINRHFSGVLLGAYGTGSMPVIWGGLTVQNHSSNSTIRELDIARQRTGDFQRVLEFIEGNKSQNITVAYCKIRGVASNGVYPQYAINHAVDGLILFNNEIFNAQVNGWWLTPHSDVKAIRNWIHNVNKGGEHATNSTGDGMQAEYGQTRLYFAGNIIDKSNAMWKYAFMLNNNQVNNVVEYNTFYAPKQGAGGAGVRWWATEGGIFRKNLVRSIGDQGQELVVPFDTRHNFANKPEPYGIRDNHILRPSGDHTNVSTQGVVLHPSNKVFHSISAYQQYLKDNPEIGQYGSDITRENFWVEFREIPVEVIRKYPRDSKRRMPR